MNNNELTLEIVEAAFQLYKPPFKFSHGYIFDDNGNMVADDTLAAARVRGWGRIGQMDNPEAIQDAVGKHIANALTRYWEYYGETHE